MNNGADLYRRYLDGDDSALEQLVKDYGDALTRFAYSYVRDSYSAEDIMEETFATLIIKRKRFFERATFKTYLYKIARNKCIDYLRYHRRFVPLKDVENVLPTSGNVEAETFRRERYAQLYKGMDKLNDRYRDVLTLAYIEGFTVAEVSRIMGKSAKQTYNLLARAKVSLKQIMQDEGVEYEGQ